MTGSVVVETDAAENIKPTKARDDLRGIYEYIAYNLFAPMAAKKLVTNIMDDILKLDTNPHIFPLYKTEPWFSRGLRFFMVKNYNVFYMPDEENNTVNIIRIMYGGRDIENPRVSFCSLASRSSRASR